MEYKTKYRLDDEIISLDGNKKYFVNEQLTCEVIRDIETFRSVSEEWNSLVVKSGASVFQTHEWQYIWWMNFAKSNNAHRLHILLFSFRDQLVGITPFFIDDFKLMGRIINRSLRLIGSKVIQGEKGKFMGRRTYSGFLDIIIYPGFEQQVCKALEEYFKEYLIDYDEVILEEIPDSSVLVSNFLPRIKDQREEWNLTVYDSSVIMTIRLPSDWNSFLSDLSRNARKKVRRYHKNVSDDSDKKVLDSCIIREQPEFSKAFEWMVEYHQKRWNKRGKPGIFNDERVYDFYKSISQLFQKKGIAQLQAVSIPGPKGQYIVIDLFLKFGRTIYSLQTSFDDSSPYSKYSPGHISLFSIIKNAIDNGMKYLNLERGQESYKSRVANNTIQNRNINIRHSSHSNTRRLILYRMLYWVFWKKYKLNYEWKILMIFCHEYHLLPGLNKYIYDLFYRISNKLSNQN